MRRPIMTAAGFFGVVLLHGGGARLHAQDLVALVKRTGVASLDSTLPAVSLDRWLSNLARAAHAGLRWETSDCGEGGDGRAAPTCVEAVISLRADTTAHLSIAAADLDGKRVTPRVWDLSIVAGERSAPIRTLHEWAAYVASHRR